MAPGGVYETMKSKLTLVASLLLVSWGLHAHADDLWSRDDLHAWCIVPFDAAHRNSEQRAAMLEQLGFKHFAYDWRAPDVPTFDVECDALQKHHIDLIACWFPSLSGLVDSQQQALLDALHRHNIHTQLWVMGAGDAGSAPDGQAKAVQQQADRLKAIVDQAKPIGCTVALYPHEGWGGRPDNDIAILDRLKQMGVAGVGLVYNFNHGKEDIAYFPDVWKKIRPYVTVVNLDGMSENGPRVLYLAQGDKELDMMRTIAQSGWHGPVGIISEQGDKDAELVLRNNLRGFDWLAAELKQPGSGGPKPSYDPPAAPAPAAAAFVPALHDQEALDASVTGVTIPNRDELRNPPITIECWARLHDAKDFNILVTSDTKASGLHWEVYTYQGNGAFSVFLPGMGGEFRSDKTVCDEAWHYFAVILEKDRVRLFVDGQLVKDSLVTAPTAPPAPGNIGIGRLVEGVHGCNGYIQDVRISRGVRDVHAVPIVPLQREADTLEFWPLDGTIQPAPPAIAPGLPEFKTIPAAAANELTPANGWPSPSDAKQWTRSNGGSTSDRYMAFDEINRQNVKQLTQAWIYHSGDGAANVQCNPIFVGGLLYVATPGLHLDALDGTTGRQVWRFAPEKQGNGLEDVPARRGLIYWAGDAQNPPRVIITMGNWMYALDPKTGKPVPAFGQNGRAPLPGGGSSVAPVLYRNFLIYPGFNRDVFAYDVRTGAQLWTFNTLPRGSEFGSSTWDNDNGHEGANDWGGISLDESRGIAYVATGSPKPNFLGMLHPGDNLFGNCVIALDAATGKRLWHFQEIRHDIWDLDIPSPPNLVTVQHDGRKIDAVAQVTKIGNVLLLDRVTGKPLFPFRMRRAPASTLPGERAANYQPDPELPEHVSHTEFSLDQVTDLNPAAHDAVMNFIKSTGATYGWFQPCVEGKPNIYNNIDGGGEWVGASVDPNGKLYVSVTQRPWYINVHRVGVANAPTTPEGQAGQKLFLANCAACHHADLGGNGFAPSLIGLGERLKEGDVQLILHQGRGGMPPQPQLNDDDISKLCAFLLAKNSNPPAQWTFDGYSHFQDPQNYPASKPPWGKLVCLDLNSGHIAWQVPVGEYPELTAKGIPKTGTPVMGGPATTSGGLVFLSGTQDPAIGAYDSDTGAELWSHALPWIGSAPPIVYQDNGHEYVALAACGGGKVGGSTGDAWVAFALPEAGTHAESSTVAPSVQGTALLDGFLDMLTAEVSLSADEKAAIKDAYLTDGTAMRDIANDKSLSPLTQERRIADLDKARRAKIEALLGDVARQQKFRAAEAKYRVALTEAAAQGGLAKPESWSVSATNTVDKD